MPRSCHLFVPPQGHPMVPRKAPLEVKHLQNRTTWGNLFLLRLSCWGGQIRAIGWGAHRKQPETSIHIVFPQTIGIPTNCMVSVCVSVCVKHILFFFPYRNYFLQEKKFLIYLGGIKKTQKTKPPQTEKKKKLAWLKNANSPAMP